MIHLSTDKKKLISETLDIVEVCNVSRGVRSAYYRAMNGIVETGRQDGNKSLMNMIYKHLDRSAALMYSPTMLHFMIDFENEYPKNIIERAKIVARIVTRSWETNNTDITFGQGVFESLKYGAALLKQWPELQPGKTHPVYQKRLVMPWQFGVYREDENELSKQPALCETTMLSMPEVWKRIWQYPDADKFYQRIKSQSSKQPASDVSNSYFHQVLSANTLQTGTNVITKPGGIVNFGNDPNYAVMGPETAIDMAKMYELWVQQDSDWVTIQLIEPDILIAPRFIAQGIGTKMDNLLIAGGHHAGLHPYTLIQPNMVHGYFWGRPEIVDLVEPQTFLSTTCEDTKRLFGLQVEKLLGIIGFDGLTDEIYDQQRGAGYISVPQGGSVSDLTPKFPPETLALIKLLKDTINELGGFPPIMTGQGEQGVRAGVHADTLLKTGSPTLRDRSLWLERQVALAADLTLSIKEAKDGTTYWTKADTMDDIHKTSFRLSDLPDDWRVSVDSHSSSPIFMDDHTQLIFALVQRGIITKHGAIDLLPVPHKEKLHIELREEEQKTAALLQQHPELLPKLMGAKGGGHR